MTDKEYYIATKDDEKQFIIYDSDLYKLSEIDLINLIKICVVGERSKAIGNKLLEAYRDSTHSRLAITEERLKLIGIKSNGNRKPTITKKAKQN